MNLSRVTTTVLTSLVLPKTIRDWELFVCGHYQNAVILNGNNVPAARTPFPLSLSRANYEEWKSFRKRPQWSNYAKMYYWIQVRDEKLVHMRQ